MPYSPNTDWKTSKGNVAPDLHWSGPDDAYNARAQLKAEVERNYAGAVVVRDATRTYNCHAFVHASSHAWFDDIAPFLRDDYYPFTPGTLQINDAVVYVKDGVITHSGFIIQLSGNTIIKLRSKWGAYPLVEHPPTSVPSIYGSIVYYLRRRTGAMVTEAEPVHSSAEERASVLLSQMLDEHRLQDLWLASTPEVVEAIVRGWPEFSELQLYGDQAAELIADRLKTAGDRAFTALLIASKYFNSPRILQALAERIASSSDAELTYDRGLLLHTFEHVSQKLLDERDKQRAAIDRARTILKR